MSEIPTAALCCLRCPSNEFTLHPQTDTVQAILRCTVCHDELGVKIVHTFKPESEPYNESDTLP